MINHKYYLKTQLVAALSLQYVIDKTWSSITAKRDAMIQTPDIIKINSNFVSMGFHGLLTAFNGQF